MVDLMNGTTINTDSSHGTDGYWHERASNNGSIFRELAVTETKQGTVDTYQVSMPITNQSLQLHQVVLATSLHYGINISLKCQHETGGSMHGVLEEDETVAEKFFCIPANPDMYSLIATGEAENPSERCDGDHKFGRDSRYFNGIFFVQGVSHQENIIRHRWKH